MNHPFLSIHWQYCREWINRIEPQWQNSIEEESRQWRDSTKKRVTMQHTVWEEERRLSIRALAGCTLFISLLSTYINARSLKLTSVAEGMSSYERRKGESLSMMTLLKYTNVALIQNPILHVWSFGRSKQDQRKERRLRMTSCVFAMSRLLNLKASIPNTISRSSGRSIVKKARA